MSDDKNGSDNIVQLGLVTQDASMMSVEATLEDALENIRSGDRKCNKMLILMLDTGTEDKDYSVGFHNSNMKCSEMIGLLTYFTHYVIHSLMNNFTRK